MKSQRSREGYLMIDHRASPGLPADIARANGLDPALAGEGKMLEAAMLACKHCQRIVVKNPLRVRERAYCAKCDRFICDGCAFRASLPDYVHAPFEKVADAILSNKPPALGSPMLLLSP